MKKPNRTHRAVAGAKRSRQQPRLRKAWLLLLVCVGSTALGPVAQGGPVVTATQHVRLGFDASFPFSESRGESYDGCPFIPPGLPAGVSYSLGIAGVGNLRVDTGVDVTIQYDKANVTAGGTLPLNVTYTPRGRRRPQHQHQHPHHLHRGRLHHRMLAGA
ncbi:MAG: hypothetical protein M5U12_33930 [Verrucomicrobia bacterium]|nr:hypothetical protein [Verrucomicrobiota bacterium]